MLMIAISNKRIHQNALAKYCNPTLT